MSVQDLIAPSYWSPAKISATLLLRSLTEAAGKHARGRLIDIGCGAKPYSSIFSPRVDSYFGVDFSGTADANYGAETKADLYIDGTDTKLPSGSFDTLLSTQVLEHVFETSKFIAECHRLLAKGGRGIFTIPFVWQCHAEPHDYFRFTRYSLDKLFRDQGFRIVEITPLGGAYAALLQTRIESLHCRELPRTPAYLPYRIARKLRNLVMLPIWNWKGLHLDKLFWNDKLCLNYLVVVAKD
jgi:SAM-dependent methyltransferase